MNLRAAFYVNCLIHYVGYAMLRCLIRYVGGFDREIIKILNLNNESSLEEVVMSTELRLLELRILKREAKEVGKFSERVR